MHFCITSVTHISPYVQVFMTHELPAIRSTCSCQCIHGLILITNVVYFLDFHYWSCRVLNLIFTNREDSYVQNASYWYLHFVAGSIFFTIFLLTSIRVSFEYYVSKLACVVGEKFLYCIHGSVFGCWWYFCRFENWFKIIDTFTPISLFCCSCCYLLCIVKQFSPLIWSCSCFSRSQLV